MKLQFKITLIFWLWAVNAHSQNKYGTAWVTSGIKPLVVIFNGSQIQQYIINPLTVDTTGKLIFNQFGSSNICDSNGNLILACNGSNLYDNNFNFIDGDIN